METRNIIDCHHWLNIIVEILRLLALEKRNHGETEIWKFAFFPGAKMKDFLYYLVPLLKKNSEYIILHFGTNDAPYWNEDEIYKELKSIKDFINKRHPSCKVYISVPILWLDNKNANSILKNADKLKVVEEKSVILHDNILSSHLNKDGLHLNSYGTIKLGENVIKMIRMFWWNAGSYKEFKYFDNASTLKHQTLFPVIILVLIKIHPSFFLNINV